MYNVIFNLRCESPFQPVQLDTHVQRAYATTLMRLNNFLCGVEKNFMSGNDEKGETKHKNILVKWVISKYSQTVNGDLELF